MIVALSSTTSTKALWYLTRASGLVSLALLTLVMVLGITEVQRWSPGRWPRFVTAGLHRNASLLAVAFLAVHVVTAVADSYAPISFVAAVVPFSSSYRPLWLGLGALALDLLIALVVTSLLRLRIPHPWWRGVHWVAYACWPVAFVHGLGTGSDGRVGWVQAIDALCLAAIVAAVAWRVATNWEADPARRLAAAIGGTGATVLVLAWALAGPVQAGWARRAGTPTALLGGRAGQAAGAQAGPTSGGSSTSTTTAAPGTTPVVPLHGSLDGTLTQSGSPAATTVTIDAVVSGASSIRVRIVLEGTELRDGGLEMRRGTVQLGPAAHPDLYNGPVSTLAGPEVIASVSGPQGPTATASIQLEIDSASNRIGGSIDVR